MSGVSFMIPFVVVGGIFIAISFMFGIYAANPNSSQYNVFTEFFSQIGEEAAFALMVPILAGYIEYSIADKQELAPAMIGGFSTLIIGRLMRKVPKSFQGLVSVLTVPLLNTLIVGAFIFFILNAPMSMLTIFLESWLTSLNGG